MSVEFRRLEAGDWFRVGARRFLVLAAFVKLGADWFNAADLDSGEPARFAGDALVAKEEK